LLDVTTGLAGKPLNALCGSSPFFGQELLEERKQLPCRRNFAPLSSRLFTASRAPQSEGNRPILRPFFFISFVSDFIASFSYPLCTGSCREDLFLSTLNLSLFSPKKSLLSICPNSLPLTPGSFLHGLLRIYRQMTLPLPPKSGNQSVSLSNVFLGVATKLSSFPEGPPLFLLKFSRSVYYRKYRRFGRPIIMILRYRRR